jgi:hypothetical protein
VCIAIPLAVLVINALFDIKPRDIFVGPLVLPPAAYIDAPRALFTLTPKLLYALIPTAFVTSIPVAPL